MQTEAHIAAMKLGRRWSLLAGYTVGSSDVPASLLQRQNTYFSLEIMELGRRWILLTGLQKTQYEEAAAERSKFKAGLRFLNFNFSAAAASYASRVQPPAKFFST